MELTDKEIEDLRGIRGDISWMITALRLRQAKSKRTITYEAKDIAEYLSDILGRNGGI